MRETERTESETFDAASGGEFEEGSEGHAPNSNGGGGAPSAGNSEGSEAAGDTFTGTLRIEGDRVVLISGGIRAEVLVSEEIQRAAEDSALLEERRRAVTAFREYQDRNITLKGVQHEEFILRARPVAMPTMKSDGISGGGSFKLDSETREVFARINQVIEANREKYFEKDYVVAVRPGFQFANGWITEKSAIVVSVRRKLGAPFLEKEALLPPSLEGFPVDVKSASPVELLMARSGSDGKDLKETAKVLPDARIAEFNSLLFALGQERGLNEDEASAAESFTEAISDIGYREPSNAHLNEVTGAMTVTCHVSPDAGWTMLRRFLDNTSNRLTIAMYDFTAPHIVRRLRSAMSHASGSLKLILGPNASLGSGTKADDLPEETVVNRLEKALRQRFEHIFAVVSGRRRVFANSYHIKVAVRDGNAFWLSSGNWQSSNQPDLNPLGADASIPGILQTYNRDWHVVVEHEGLAQMYEKFIEWDMELSGEAGGVEAAPEVEEELPDLFVPEEFVALEAEESGRERPRYFQPARFTFTSQRPLRVQPLLTPDNYAEHVLRHIRSARERLYFQNQSITILKNNESQFKALLEALLDKAKTIDDVRIIVRSEFGAREMVESLRVLGFDPAMIKVQARCHTKGIVVDSKAVLIGSHNWTNSGTLYNRDASLIFHDEGIAKYYEEIFLYDWEHLAHQRINEESVPMLATDKGEESEPAGMVRVQWRNFYEDML